MDRATVIRDGPWGAVLPSWDQVGSRWRTLEQMLLAACLSPPHPAGDGNRCINARSPVLWPKSPEV